MELVAFLGTDKDNWGQISALINRGKWDKVIIVKNKDSEDFPYGDETIKIDSETPLIELKGIMMEKLKAKIGGDFEVALSIASGNGKEHMALISALLSIPVGIRFVAFTRKGVEFFN
ncbi:MAG: hypothetical protein Q8Q31_02915 [Nanoarchaeota archaeon]|nr:hypothetical protein [Nanoarchaeota archaeon]